MITPSRVIFSAALIMFLCNIIYLGTVFLLEKLKVMILHLYSFITILSFSVLVDYMSRTSWRNGVGLPENEWTNVLSSKTYNLKPWRVLHNKIRC